MLTSYTVVVSKQLVAGSLGWVGDLVTDRAWAREKIPLRRERLCVGDRAVVADWVEGPGNPPKPGGLTEVVAANWARWRMRPALL